ncbi:hypothetical protein Bca101_099899 [Brassica carinata]
MQRYVLSGYHLKTLHYSLTHDLHSMRFQDLQGGGGSSIKRLATPPPLFKSVCYVFGSLGLSTMEVDMLLLDSQVTAVVPSGASTGIYETLELSDGGSDYLGKDVYKLGANGIIDACKPGAIVNGIRLYKAKIEEQQVNID